jgi:hypothetical protein
MLDFTIAKMNHQMWKRKLDKFVNLNEPIDESEMVSERDCKLGKWLYADGIGKYGKWSEIHSLEEVHKKLHKLTFSILNNKKSGDMETAREELDTLGKTSEKIVGLLNTLEEKLKNVVD